MQTIMIHEVNDTILHNLSKYECEDVVLTFDDGLYSQYHYLSDIEHMFPESYFYFFISTNIVNNTYNRTVDIDCRTAHKNFFTNSDTSPYMSWDEIKIINSLNNCSIGGHGHNHHRFKYDNIRDSLNLIKKDTDLMVNTFKSKNINTNIFCFPYNNENEIYTAVLKRHRFKTFFGKGRIDIGENNEQIYKNISRR